MTQQDRQSDARVRILRVADRAAWGNFFASEMAVIISGAGAIEVEEDKDTREMHAFTAGDVVLIPPQLVYRVRNRNASEPLLAWVFFAEEKEFYWPDGRRA